MLELWIQLAVGVVSITIFSVSIHKQPSTEGLLAFFCTSTLSLLIAPILVSMGCFEFENRLLADYFQTSILYEVITLPSVVMLYHQFTYRSRLKGILLQAALFSGVLTFIEVIIERYTELISYLSWNWFHTFWTVLVMLLLVKGIVQIVRSHSGRQLTN